MIFSFCISRKIFLRVVCPKFSSSSIHYSAGDAYVLEKAVVLRELLQYLAALGVHLIEGCGIGIDAQLLELGQRIAAYLFLFSKFCHNMFVLFVVSIIKCKDTHFLQYTNKKFSSTLPLARGSTHRE